MINDFPSGYADSFNGIMNYDVCSQAGNFFEVHTNKVTCQSFFSNSTSYVIVFNTRGLKYY